jgi:effector-binding domain-containing protein
MAEFRRIETGKIVCLEETGPYSDLGRLFSRLQEFMRARGVSARGDRMAVIYDDPLTANPERMHFAAALELGGEATGDGEVTIVTQPSGWVASETHQGDYTQIREAYDRLFTWVREHGYRVTGPAREYYLAQGGPGGGGDPAQAVTEIHLPVEKMEI